MVRQLMVTTAVFLLLLLRCRHAVSQDFDHYTNDFVAEIDGDHMVAELVAGSHDLQLFEQVEFLGPNVFHFISESTAHRSKRSSETLLDRLRRDANVLHVEQLRLLERHKRMPLEHEKREIIYDKQSELERPQVDQEVILERYFGSSKKRGQRCTREENAKRGLMEFDDPLFCLQWYLYNDGTTKGHLGFDVRAADVWKLNITGRGVVVTVLDDGLDRQHLDLKENYDAEASYDLNDRDDMNHDPTPSGDKMANAHGTRCAGEIAASANNGVCGVGIAYNSRIGGVRMLDGAVTDKLEGEALGFKRNYIDVYSASWGPKDDGQTMEGPGHFASKALKDGAEQGRDGHGSIFAWATGNGGENDDCGCDGYVSSIYTISIGCVNAQGLSTYFSEICPSTMAVIFTGGSHVAPGRSGYNHPDISIITTDINNGCDVDFEGTSSAAPLAAGVFALVLEANPRIGWRDMQYLLTMTAHIPNELEKGWTMNGGGLHVNHKFGFGVIDAEMMVLGAFNWTTVPEQKVCDVAADNDPIEIPEGGSVKQTLHTDACQGRIKYLEHTQIHVVITPRRRGDLSIKIKSPAGTVSEILSLRKRDAFSGEEMTWTFMTVHNWGEDPSGDWELSIDDEGTEPAGTGELTSWSLTLYGIDTENPNQVRRRKQGEYVMQTAGGTVDTDNDIKGKTVDGSAEKQEAHMVSQSEVQAIMKSEMETTNAERNELQQRVEATRKRLAELNDLARKMLSGEDYELYKKYVLGEEGQKEIEKQQQKQAEYTDNWWKRTLEEPERNDWASDNMEEQRYLGRNEEPQGNYRPGYLFPDQREVNSEGYYRNSDKDVEELYNTGIGEGHLEGNRYNRKLDSVRDDWQDDRTRTENEEKRKIDEILALIDEMIDNEKS